MGKDIEIIAFVVMIVGLFLAGYFIPQAIQGNWELPMIISTIKDVITALSAATAAVVAILGLRAWRNQLKGKTEYALAQRLLRSVYTMRNAFIATRKPGWSEDEDFQAMQDINEKSNLLSDTEIKWHKVEAVSLRRRQAILDALIELDATSLEAEALWGQDVRENLSPMNRCAYKLLQGIQRHLSLLKQLGDFDGDPNETIDIVFDWTGKPDDNPFSREVADAVSQAEKFIKPRLKI